MSTTCTATADRLQTDLPTARSTVSARAERGARVLRWSAAAWFTVAATGQLIFVAYILSAYGLAALRGDFAAWNQVMPKAWVPGATLQNSVVGAHLAFAASMVVGGLLQLIPAIRRHWPRFHRWNGRVYLSSVILMCTAGLIMLVTREPQGEPLVRWALAFNVVLILWFAVEALRHARARRIDAHRRWAVRLFLAASGAWMFRIGLMFWLVVNQGPVGFDPQTFRGPFLVVLGFAQYLLPLAIAELYFRARDRGGVRVRYAMAGGMGVVTLVTATGIAAASMILWLPKM